MASEKSFLLEIITPQKSVFKGNVVSVTSPGTEGSFQVLKNHAAFLASLQQGDVNVEFDDQTIQTFKITGGFFEVSLNSAIVLAEGVQS